MDAIRNAIESLLVLQTAEGILPYAGNPFFTIRNGTLSYTYHLHSLIGIYTYYFYTGDQDWLSRYWDQYKLGLGWSLSKIDDSGLYNLTNSADWCRSGIGGHNIEANAILYYVLNAGIRLAGVLGDSAAAETYTASAASIKEAANRLLWDESLGYYTDNDTTKLPPQDGNSFAGMFDYAITSSVLACL